MAKISDALEEYLKTLPPETQKVLRPLCEADPKLGEGWLRQSDYDRLMNEGKKTIEESTEWKKWAETNVPIHKQVLEQHEKLSKRAKELEAQVAEAAKKVTETIPQLEGNVDANKILEAVNERISKAGYLTKAEQAQIVAEETKKQIDSARDQLLKETLPNWTSFIFTGMDLELSHRQEFNEPLDRKALDEYRTKNQIADWKKAYEMMVADRRQAKKIEDEVEKRVKDEMTKRNLPGTSGPSTPQPTGAVAARMERDRATGNGALGDLSSAAAAAAELRNEGKIEAA